MGYDTVIIGGGSAGCVLANRLSADPARSVALLEAGPDYASTTLPDDIADGTTIADSHDWGLTDAGGRPLPRGRIMGGCSAVNACFALRGHPADYDAWGPGWSWNDVAPPFRAIERDLDFGGRPGHGSDGPLPVVRYRDLTPLHSAFLALSPTIEDHNSTGTPGAGLLPTTCVDGKRISTATAFLDPVRGRANLTVRAGSQVHHIVVRQGKAVGVVLEDGTLVEADQVIVAAGAYASPVLLLRSGIDRPGIGEGLTDHVGVSVDFPVPADWPQFPVFQTLMTLHSEYADPAGPPDLQIFPAGAFAVPSSPTGKAASLCVTLVQPQSQGRIWLADGEPRIDLAHLREAADRKRLSDGVRHAEALVERMTGVRATADLDDPWTYHHPVGSCAMGRVVDRTGRVDGVDGLLVVDASVMPSIPSANTNLPTIMLAHRLAETA